MSILGRIGIVILPLLVLASEQADRAADVTQEFGPIHVHHLDEVKSPSKIARIIRNIKKCHNNRNISVTLFASPQVLVNDDLPWKTLLPQWNKECLITSLFLDELHLWLQYALSIREPFITVGTEIFPDLFPRNQPARHVPVCGMTATFSPKRKALFERLTGISFHAEDVLWATPAEMSRQKIVINLQYGSSLLGTRYHPILNFFKDCPNSKIIFYFNSRFEAIAFKEKLDTMLAVHGINVDSLLVHGNLPRQIKAMRIRLFTGALKSKHLKNIRAFIATEPVAGLGLDCPAVREVDKSGMCESVYSEAQIIGRLARQKMAELERDHFNNVFSVDDFAYLFERAHNLEREQVRKCDAKVKMRKHVPAIHP